MHRLALAASLFALACASCGSWPPHKPYASDPQSAAASLTTATSVASRCIVIPDGPEVTVWTPPRARGVRLGAKLRADGELVRYVMIEHGLPRGWRTRLVKNDVFGVPVWTIDGGQSVSFALRTVPSLEQQGLTIHGLVLTHVGRDHAFPLDARIEPADAAGLEERLRQLGLR
jgi:hypothetical protein